MDETEVRTRKIKIDQEKMKYINFAYNEETTCPEKSSFGQGFRGERRKIICKEKIEKTVNTDEIIFYLKSMYSTHNEEPITFIDYIPTDDPSFEAMTNYLKTFSKCSKDDENMSLKNKCLFGG